MSISKYPFVIECLLLDCLYLPASKLTQKHISNSTLSPHRHTWQSFPIDRHEIVRKWAEKLIRWSRGGTFINRKHLNNSTSLFPPPFSKKKAHSVSSDKPHEVSAVLDTLREKGGKLILRRGGRNWLFFFCLLFRLVHGVLFRANKSAIRTRLKKSVRWPLSEF